MYFLLHCIYLITSWTITYCIRAKDKNAEYAIQLSDRQIVAFAPLVLSLQLEWKVWSTGQLHTTSKDGVSSIIIKLAHRTHQWQKKSLQASVFLGPLIIPEDLLLAHEWAEMIK